MRSGTAGRVTALRESRSEDEVTIRCGAARVRVRVRLGVRVRGRLRVRFLVRVSVRLRVRSRFLRNECPKRDPNPGKTCHDVTSLRLSHCARPLGLGLGTVSF